MFSTHKHIFVELVALMTHYLECKYQPTQTVDTEFVNKISASIASKIEMRSEKMEDELKLLSKSPVILQDIEAVFTFDPFETDEIEYVMPNQSPISSYSSIRGPVASKRIIRIPSSLVRYLFNANSLTIYTAPNWMSDAFSARLEKIKKYHRTHGNHNISVGICRLGLQLAPFADIRIDEFCDKICIENKTLRLF